MPERFGYVREHHALRSNSKNPSWLDVGEDFPKKGVHMKILAIVLSYALAVMVGAVVSAAMFRAKRRKTRKRCAEFLEKRNSAADAKRDMEQAVLHIKKQHARQETRCYRIPFARMCGGMRR